MEGKPYCFFIVFSSPFASRLRFQTLNCQIHSMICFHFHSTSTWNNGNSSVNKCFTYSTRTLNRRALWHRTFAVSLNLCYVSLWHSNALSVPISFYASIHSISSVDRLLSPVFFLSLFVEYSFAVFSAIRLPNGNLIPPKMCLCVFTSHPNQIGLHSNNSTIIR